LGIQNKESGPKGPELRVSGVGCQVSGRKTKNLKPQSLRPAKPSNYDLASKTRLSILNQESEHIGKAVDMNLA
jgi:hypothetical protein